MTQEAMRSALEALKPCPFCGSAPEAATYTVTCINPFCGAQPETAGQSQAEAIAAWNRRSQLSKALEDAGSGPLGLSVWFGPMPESNGKANWTAILHRGDISEGFTIERSEHHDRVRYDADKVRWLIGDLETEPFILDYDGDMLWPSGWQHPCGVVAHTALENGGEAQGWRPIETAPKDTRVLLFWPSFWNSKPRIETGQWKDDRYANRPKPYWSGDQERIFGVRAYRESAPTHWQSIEPPAAAIAAPDASKGDKL